MRLAVLRGAQLGLLWAIVGRVWMRLLSEQEIFSVGGTILIFLVVSGFGALAGYAFAVRRRPTGAGARGRARRWLVRFFAFVPFLGMGPFAVFFAGNFLYALVSAHGGWRRLVRWPLAVLGALFSAFWTLVFISQNPEGPGWASAVLYLGLGYLLFVALRFAFSPGAAQPRPVVGALEV